MNTWNPFKLSQRGLPALALLACWTIGAVRAAEIPSKPDDFSSDQRPAGVQRGAWAQMMEQIQADQMNVREMTGEGGRKEWQVSNHPQDLAARFDGTTLVLSSPHTSQDGWRLRMEFASYGHGTASYCAPVTEVVVVSSRVEYRRGPVTEWWCNQPTGLEHGVTLHEPPMGETGAGPLRLALALRDGLRARAAEAKAQGVELADTTGAVVRYGGLKVWDATGRTLPAWMEVTAEGQQVDIVVEDTDARYPVVVDPTFTLVRKLTASDGAAADHFGYSVAVSGDVVGVGAQDDDIGVNADQGSVYVFERNHGGTNNWGLVKKLAASDGATGDDFGYAVSVSGDVLVAGAPVDDVGANFEQGSAYVFERNTGGTNNWGQVRRLTASDGTTGDQFGYSVSISGDIVVVGAVVDDSTQGSAYVFERNAGGANNWGPVKRLTASDGAGGDWFGYAVSVSGNVAAVGAPMDDVGANFDQGSAYMFERNVGGANNWGEVKRLTASDGIGGEQFGFSVSVSGDIVAAGAPLDDVEPGFGQGSAYVFGRNVGGANNWGQVKRLAASNGVGGDQFGFSVSVNGDVAAVGVPVGDVGANAKQGSAYVFERNAGGTNNWGQSQKLFASDGRFNDGFGYAVSVSGTHVVVAAVFGEVGSNFDQGSAYLFGLAGPGTDLGNSVDSTNLAWSTGGDAPWFGRTSASRDEEDAAQSGAIAHLQESWLQTTVVGPGTLTFWWKVSSEMDYDVLEFSIDNVSRRGISGEEDWEQLSFAIPAGTHTLRWRYAKDDATALGQDGAWLDEVVFKPDSGSPMILAQPSNQSVGMGDTVTLRAGVGGGTPRSYQWLFNENAIAGGTNVFLTLPNVGPAAAGNYVLMVSNSLGLAISSNAVLTVTTSGPVQGVLLLVDPSFPSVYRAALDDLGLTYESFTDYAAFHVAVANADPATTLVVVDVPDANAVLNPVARFANAGGRAILQYWALNSGSALAAAFNASVVPPLLTTPLPVYDWGGSPFFAGLTSPIRFVDTLVHDGEMLQPIAGGQAVAGYDAFPEADQAALVTGHSGRTIISGFMLVEVSVLSDAVRFAQNEIQYLLALRTVYLSSPMWVGGQFQVMLTGTTGLTYSLRGTSNFVNWTTVTNVTLSASPMFLTVPASANWSFYRAVTPPVP